MQRRIPVWPTCLARRHETARPPTNLWSGSVSDRTCSVVLLVLLVGAPCLVVVAGAAVGAETVWSAGAASVGFGDASSPPAHSVTSHPIRPAASATKIPATIADGFQLGSAKKRLTGPISSLFCIAASQRPQTERATFAARYPRCKLPKTAFRQDAPQQESLLVLIIHEHWVCRHFVIGGAGLPRGRHRSVPVSR